MTGTDLTHTGSMPVVSSTSFDPESMGAPELPIGYTVQQQIGAQRERAALEIFDWWGRLSEADARACLDKMREYGSSDLDIMGQAMLAQAGVTWEGRDSAELEPIKVEMSLMFYIQGKVARAYGAYQRGELPSDDTLRDIVAYGMMARRVRETGRWG